MVAWGWTRAALAGGSGTFGTRRRVGRVGSLLESQPVWFLRVRTEKRVGSLILCGAVRGADAPAQAANFPGVTQKIEWNDLAKRSQLSAAC
jgi:hypothetical protein